MRFNFIANLIPTSSAVDSELDRLLAEFVKVDKEDRQTDLPVPVNFCWDEEWELGDE